jgi:hypothetical protein
MQLRLSNTGPVVGWMIRLSVDFPNAVANSVVTVAGLTVPGAAVGDSILWQVNDATLNAGLFPVQNALITAANTVTLTLGNCTAGALNPGAVNCDLLVLKRPLLSQI